MMVTLSAQIENEIFVHILGRFKSEKKMLFREATVLQKNVELVFEEIMQPLIYAWFIALFVWLEPIV